MSKETCPKITVLAINTTLIVSTIIAFVLLNQYVAAKYSYTFTISLSTAMLLGVLGSAFRIPTCLMASCGIESLHIMAVSFVVGISLIKWFWHNNEHVPLQWKTNEALVILGLWVPVIGVAWFVLLLLSSIYQLKLKVIITSSRTEETQPFLIVPKVN